MLIYVIFKLLSWDGDQKEDLGKPSLKYPSQAIGGKLSAILSHVVIGKAQSAFRKEQGSTHVLWCWKRLAAPLCMK
jgi:hypothetical protein